MRTAASASRHHATLALGGCTIRLKGPRSAVDPLVAVLGKVCIQGDRLPPLEVTISLDRRRALGTAAGRSLWSLSLPPLGWLGLLVGQIVATITTLLTRLLFVHAGVVAVGGRGWVIIGESGAGKTSTVAALVQRGAAYLSDEVALFDAEAGTAAPFLLPMAVKPWTARAAGISHVEPEIAREGGVRFWLPAHLMAEPVPVDTFILLNPARRSPRITAVSRASMLLALGRHTSSFSQRHRVGDALAGFGRLLRSAACLTLGGRHPAGCVEQILLHLRRQAEL